MKPSLLLLCLLCLLCGCGRMPDEELAGKVDALSEQVAELCYTRGVNDGMKLSEDIRQRFVLNESEATALMNQRRTNFLATQPWKLKP